MIGQFAFTLLVTMISVLGFFTVLAVGYCIGKLIKAIVKWRKGAHE